MKIQKFDGGLSTRQRPQLINLDEAVTFENVDNSTGVLAPVNSKTQTATETKKYVTWYKAGAEFISSDNPRQYVEFQKVLYWVDGTNEPKRYDGTETKLGIAAPTTKPTIASTIPDAPTEAKLVSGTGGNLPAATHTYIFVNDSGTVYSKALALQIDLLSGTRINLDREDLYTVYGQARIDPIADVITTNTANRQVTISDVKGITYGANGVRVYRLYAQKYYLVGTLTGPTDSLVDSVYDISANAEYDVNLVGSIVGDIQYVYTFYNSTLGIESAPSPVSDTLDANGAITLSNLEVSSDSQVDKKRIYRVGGDISTFSLVTEIDNADTSYIDDNKDTEIDGRVLTSQDNDPAPNDLQFIIEAYAMLFAAQGAKLRFTPIGQPTVWPEQFFLNFDDDITGLAQVGNGVLVFTRYRTFIVTGTGPTTLAQYLLSEDQGCIAWQSIQVIGSEAIWASTDGVCSSNGGKVNVLSKDKLGKITLDPVDSAVYDEVYYLLESDNSILALDFRFGRGIFKRLNLGVEQLVVANDILYGWSNGLLHSLYTNSTKETFTYKSPRFVEGSVTEEKYYKKVYIYSEGDIIINVLIDDVLVATKTLSGKDRQTIQVPHDKQRGQYIQFEITGTGEVFEIEYIAGRKQNE